MSVGCYVRNPVTIQKLRESMERRHRATVFLCTICKSLGHTTAEHAQRVGEALKGKKLSQAHRDKIGINSRIMWQNPESRAKLLNEKRFKAISEGNKRRWEDPIYREKQRIASIRVKKKNSASMKEFWSNPANREQRIREILGATMKRPTTFEIEVSNAIKLYDLPLCYTGDGVVVMEGINPDFIAVGLSGIVEIFYSYWKIRNHSSVENYIKERVKRLSQYSWLFLDEEDVAGGVVAEKLLEFIGQLKYNKEHSKICGRAISGYDFSERMKKLRGHYKRGHPREFRKWYK